MNLFPKPDAVSDHDYRVYVIFAIVGYIGTPVHLLLVPYFAAIGAPWLSGLNVASAVAWGYSLVANRRGHHNVAITLVTIEVFVHSVACAVTLGLSIGFHHYLWGGLPFIMLNSRLSRLSIACITTGLGVTFLLLTIFASSVEYAYGYAGTVPYVHAANVAIAFVASALVAYHVRAISQDAERALDVLASTDALTGLFNRRRLAEEISRRLILATREGLALSLVLVDVDHFKTVNDTHGHDGGDIVLKEVARRLSHRLRRSDLIGRWGGEEFLMLLHGPREHAHVAADTLRRAVAEGPVSVGAHAQVVTVTLGGAHYRAREDLTACVRRADHALYRGKGAGRNCVVFDG